MNKTIKSKQTKKSEVKIKKTITKNMEIKYMPNYAVEMVNITKVFGTFVANNGINLRVKKNEIHGIIGENGAGKSTLMSILFGLVKPTTGYILVNGKEAFLKSATDAQKVGIGMVHQHFKLVDIYNSVENIILGQEPIKKFGWVEFAKAKKNVKKLAEEFNFDINLNAPVSKLSVGEQQKIEILKLLYRNSEILIFDEPTGVLTPQDIKDFLKLLKDFKAKGKTIIIISHKLEEIKEVCDTATIIRHGKVIDVVNPKTTSIEKLSTLMVGKKVENIVNKSQNFNKEIVLSVKNLNVPQTTTSSKLENISFDLHAGEILAIAGVGGNGQSELINYITGISKFTRKVTGSIVLNNQEIEHLTISERYNLGLSHIPEDRQKYGLVLDFKLKDGLYIQEYNKQPFAKYGFSKEKEIEKWARKIINEFDVRGANNGERLSRSLSGGNQQKAIVGREILRKHNAIIVAQPTRGLDVGAIENIHKRLINEKAKGNATLLISYELDEIFKLADRIIVISNGNLSQELNPRNTSMQQIGLLMAGKMSQNKALVKKGVK